MSDSKESSSTAKAGRQSSTASVVARIAICVVIVVVGFAAMKALAALKKPPSSADIGETVLSVEVIEVVPEDVTVTISGFGQAVALNTVDITPEVVGNVVEIHPRLEVGEVIPEGELLFRIDPRNYAGSSQQAEAQAEQMRATIARLKRQSSIDQARLETLARSRQLAQGEFERVRELFEKDDVGTRSGVDAAESALNLTTDNFDRLNQQVALYPLQISEAEAGLAAAEAMMDVAEANVSRTEVRAPFTGRIKFARVELGQYVAPGAPVLSMADDSVLEVSVSIDSRDARNWLRFSDANASRNAWFGEVEAVPCKVIWTESDAEASWEGVLHRVERFDESTRTVTLAVRVQGSAVSGSTDQLPLVEGMFCSVEIPGKTMRDVYRLPRWAVSFEGDVYVSEDKRLIEREVEVVRDEGDDVFVRDGLSPGDKVIVTRLSNPLPRTRLEFSNPTAAPELDS